MRHVQSIFNTVRGSAPDLGDGPSPNGVHEKSPLARPMNSQADQYLQATLSAAGLGARKSLYDAHRGLSEHPAVLTIELANALVSNFKRCARRV